MRLHRGLGALAGALVLAGLFTAACTIGYESDDLPAPKADPRVDRSKLSGELNLLYGTEYLPREVLDHFEQLYGVKINAATYSSTEEMIAKLRAGTAGYDVIFPSDYAVRILKRSELLQRIDRSNVPNLVNLADRFRSLPYDPHNAVSIPFLWGTTGIVINTDKLEPDLVKAWSDLWKPELKGQLVVVDDAREVIGLALRAAGRPPNSKDRAELEEARQKLKELITNISDSPGDLLLSGEVAAGVMWSADAARAIQADHNLRYVIPSEGLTIRVETAAIPKGAPHKYTAEVFINYLLEPSVSATISMEHLYSNPNQEAQELLPAFHRENPAFHLPDDAWGKAHWRDDPGEDGEQLYDRLWSELKG